MNPEMVELYRAVQKYRGRWQERDRYFDVLNSRYGTLCAFRDTNKDRESCEPTDIIWIPPVYSDDERCLDAILGEYSYEKWEDVVGYVYCVWTPKSSRPFIKATLPEALLRAIAAKGE